MRDDWDSGPFEPVHLQTDAGECDICNTMDAAEMLLFDWPTGETALRVQARMTCMKVLAGSAPPASARNAFIEAAKEARMLAEAYEHAH